MELRAFVSDVSWCWVYAQKYDYKVKMCCPKCEEKVREEAYEVPGEMPQIFGQTDLHISSYVCTFRHVGDGSKVCRLVSRSFARCAYIEGLW